MVKTYGSTHVALAVRDVNRASASYRSVFGAVEVFDAAARAVTQLDDRNVNWRR